MNSSFSLLYTDRIFVMADGQQQLEMRPRLQSLTELHYFEELEERILLKRPILTLKEGLEVGTCSRNSGAYLSGINDSCRCGCCHWCGDECGAKGDNDFVWIHSYSDQYWLWAMLHFISSLGVRCCGNVVSAEHPFVCSTQPVVVV